MTILVVDVAIVLAIPGQPASFFISFAVVATLWFMDFDGTARERLAGYAIGSGAGIVCVAVGSLAGGSTPVAVLTAFVVCSAFCFVRILPGTLPQCVVGPQLGLLLALLTPDEPNHLWSHVLGWTLGALVSVAVAMVVFPRQESAQLREVLASWTRKLGDIVRRADVGPASEELREFAAYSQYVEQYSGGPALHTNSLAPTIHALVELKDRVPSDAACISAVLQEFPAHAPTLSTTAELSAATADALHAADAALTGANAPQPVGMTQVRARDARAVVESVACQLGAADSATTIGFLHRYQGRRIVSLIAMQVQDFALASRGVRHRPDPSHELHGVGTTLRRNLTWQSPAVRDCLRVGFAVALAVLVAKLLGVEHGFWAASVALTISSAHLTRRGTQNAAGQMVAGAVGGFAVAAVALAVLPPVFVFGLLAIAAFISKYEAGRNALVVQLTYTPFAILNLACLDWPASSVSHDFRLRDVAIGAGVAVVAALIATPADPQRRIDRLWLGVAAAATQLVDDPRAQADRTAPPARQFELTSVRYLDAVRFVAPALAATALPRQRARAAWIRQVEYTIAAGHVALAEHRAPTDQRILAALTSPDPKRSLESVAATLEPQQAGQLTAAVWIEWWMSYLTATKPT